METKTLYENQIGQWIASRLKEAQFKIDADALQILTESMGSDLSKIEKEIVKLKIILAPNTTITAHHVEQHIGLSRVGTPPSDCQVGKWELVV